jgi:hypothetical protein
MLPPDSILKHAAAGLVVAPVVGGLIGGVELAMGSLLCALVAHANLAVHRWLSERLLTGRAGGSLLGFKMLGTLAVFFLLFQLVSPLALVLGLSSVLFAAAISGATQGMREVTA